MQNQIWLKSGIAAQALPQWGITASWGCSHGGQRSVPERVAQWCIRSLVRPLPPQIRLLLQLATKLQKESSYHAATSTEHKQGALPCCGGWLRLEVWGLLSVTGLGRNEEHPASTFDF